MENPKSLFLFGVLLLQYSCLLELVTSSSNFTDQSALLAIQSKLTFDPSNTVLGANWTTNTSFCNWIGVSCGIHRQRVTALDLSSMGLHGTIAPHVGNLSFLVSLDLRNNSFSGALPHDISRLHRLRILVSDNNQLEGTIPPSLYYCQKLEIIFLHENKLTGEIPSSLGNVSTLQMLSLDGNDLNGSFPSTLFNLSSLVEVYLSSENMSARSLPMDLCHYWPSIRILYLAGINLVGQIPSSIHECTQLVKLMVPYNKLVGNIPDKIGLLQNLEELNLGQNGLTGNIPPTIGNISSLQVFNLGPNLVTGSIPRELGRLSNLTYFSFYHNSLTGAIPQELFNMSSLQTFSLQANFLSGTFPPSNKIFLPCLEQLYYSYNNITGNIPSYFTNLSNLVDLDAANNLHHGPIPTDLGSLKYLKLLVLGGNHLTGEPGVKELRFLSSLFNSSSLTRLFLEKNPLNGVIPDILGNYSHSSIQLIIAPGCQIQGHIPKTIGSLKNLTNVILYENNISGKLPSSIGQLKKLERLQLDENDIEDAIPEELCLLVKLGELSLSNNKISGSIPDCIGKLSLLKTIYLDSNRLTSSVPLSLWNLKDLLFLNFSSNSLAGDLPASANLDVLQMVDLSWNQFRGSIPSVIGSFQSMNCLNLSNNMFVGYIPESFGDLKGLEYLDLSYNELSGTIPKTLENLAFLNSLNFSFNKLSGEIPSKGPFVNFTDQSFLANGLLCGRSNFGVPPCKAHSKRKSNLKYVLPAIASTTVLLGLILLWKKKPSEPSSDEKSPSKEHKMVSYHDLRLATNDFCESNSIGVGSFGSVYKGLLSDGTVVAIKVLNLLMEGAFKSFDAECKVLRTIRHRNLVKVITACSSHEVKALVLQYMSNGSLEKWLYSHNYCLSILERVSMLIDIASALEYLHHGQEEAVVHCDLKPANILLDEDMVAHVADFGLAKFLAKNKEETLTRTIGSLGYIAPEYGSAGKVSKKGDVYSFGIMLLEIMVRKKPTDRMFAGELTLRQWINVSIPENVLEVVDSGLLSIEEGRDMNATETILVSILEIGLRCSEEVAEDRLETTDVVPKLKKIKLALQG